MKKVNEVPELEARHIQDVIDRAMGWMFYITLRQTAARQADVAARAWNAAMRAKGYTELLAGRWGDKPKSAKAAKRGRR